MPSHSRHDRRRDVQPEADSGRTEQSAVSRGVSVEEGLIPDVDRLPQPAGFGEEASTSQQSGQLLAEYEVPAGSIAELREASISLQTNGQGRISLAGTQYGPFTGAVDVSIPLDPSVLTPGYKIRVIHQSTDGNNTTTTATLVVAEV